MRSASQHFAASMLHRIWGAWAELVARRQRLLVKEQHLQQLGARRLLATKLHNWQQAARSSAFVRRYYCARAWATWAENAADAKVDGMGFLQGEGFCMPPVTATQPFHVLPTHCRRPRGRCCAALSTCCPTARPPGASQPGARWHLVWC